MSEEINISKNQLKVIGVILLLIVAFWIGFFVREKVACQILKPEQMVTNAEHFLFGDGTGDFDFLYATRGLLNDKVTIGQAKSTYRMYGDQSKAMLSYFLSKICYGDYYENQLPFKNDTEFFLAVGDLNGLS